jgi:hypothetical protein
MSSKQILISVLVVGLLAGLAYYLSTNIRITARRSPAIMDWLHAGSRTSAPVMQIGTKCGDAPFIFPTNGIVGYLWGDSFRPGHAHQGLDIFAGTEINVTPVAAAYSGYLTRLFDWKSSVIVRVPSDPLQPGRQIWVYYTHMADPEGNSFIDANFPPGTREQYIEAGTLLGYQGNYSGDPNNPVGVHLHISIVQDDGDGNFKNELDIRNTYDPTPYFGFDVNAAHNDGTIPFCDQGAVQ